MDKYDTWHFVVLCHDDSDRCISNRVRVYREVKGLQNINGQFRNYPRFDKHMTRTSLNTLFCCCCFGRTLVFLKNKKQVAHSNLFFS